ncbi:MAG: caspase family protein [Chitinophagaceae bacterium]
MLKKNYFVLYRMLSYKTRNVFRFFMFAFSCMLFLQCEAQQTAIKNYKSAFDTTTSDEVFFPIKTVNRITEDSAVITIQYGMKDGIFPGAEANVMSSHNSGGGATRETVVYMGPASFISLTDSSATFSVAVYKKFINEKILPDDLLGISTFPIKNNKSNIFYELAKLDILFLDNDKKEIKGKRDILQNTQNDFEEQLLKDYTNEITGFYETLREYADTAVTSVYYTNGPYKGLRMLDVFKAASKYDLRSFFQFVKQFPGKYMGKAWKINETFATWVLNNAPLGDNNRNWLVPFLQQTKNNSEIVDFTRKNKFVILYDTLVQWSEKVFSLQNAGQIDEASLLCDKMILVAKELRDSKAENEFYYARSFLTDAAGNKKEAIAEALKAYNSDKTSINYTYQLASLYGKNEEFDKCFKLYDELLKALPGNTNVLGNYGWYKITAGQFKEAIPYCKAAFEGDKTSVAFTVNYGHTFLLTGNIDSARYYYLQTLENFSTPADYYEGPKTDFDLFFKKGWERKHVAAMADWMEQQFNKKYLAITKGNDVWNEAKKEYNNKNYLRAVPYWQSYISLFDTAEEPPVISIHHAINWIGLSYSMAKSYDSARVYYLKALKIAKENLSGKRNIKTTKDNDDLVSDYERLYNLSTTIKNQADADKYKMLLDAETQKVTELFTSPALHMISLSAETGLPSVKNTKSAEFIYNSFSSMKKEITKAGFTKLLEGRSLTKEKLISNLEELRSSSKPEDIFIFYFAGNTITANNQSYLEFNEKDTAHGRISILEFMNAIDLVYAHKKMIISDKPSSALLSLITSTYSNAGKNASEIIFLSPGIETPEQDNGISLFTNQLVTTLNDLQKNDKFSAKDFADKASFVLGRGQYYFPVLSFSYGKDFLLYENKAAIKPADNSIAVTSLRGVDIGTSETEEADNVNGPQKNYALLFATDIYKDPGFHKLVNPIYDAKALAKVLKDEFGFDTTLVINPTLDKIETILSKFRDDINYGPNDQLFIFFAGHGLYYEKIKMGFLVASDSKVEDQNFKSYLSYNDLGSKYLKNINCNRIFVTLDACFAGSFFDNSSFRGGPTEVDAKNLSTLKRLATKQRFYKGISSGGKQYVEDGKPGQHSPFASKFIEMLTQKALNKNFVTADEIIGEIKSNPPGATAICEGKFHYSDPQSHFIFEMKTNQKVSDVKKDKIN